MRAMGVEEKAQASGEPRLRSTLEAEEVFEAPDGQLLSQEALVALRPELRAAELEHGLRLRLALPPLQLGALRGGRGAQEVSKNNRLSFSWLNTLPQELLVRGGLYCVCCCTDSSHGSRAESPSPLGSSHRKAPAKKSGLRVTQLPLVVSRVTLFRDELLAGAASSLVSGLPGTDTATAAFFGGLSLGAPRPATQDGGRAHISHRSS